MTPTEVKACLDPGTLTADGFDEALIGTVSIWGKEGQATVALYDYEACVAILMRDALSREDAEEYLQFNTLGAYVGPLTPAYGTLLRTADIQPASSGPGTVPLG
jgi:hypothetical protein